jgi:hypothetical protein
MPARKQFSALSDDPANVTPMRHDGTVEPDAPGVWVVILNRFEG